MKNYLVFDIGGTNTRIAFFKNNKIIEKEKFKTINSNKLLNKLILKIEYFLKKYNLKKFDGIAISAPGCLCRKKLELTAPVNLPNIKKLSLKKLKKFCGKIILQNDAACAALGALSLEKNIKNLVCFTLGTGLGCGLILNKKLYQGKEMASQFGHTTIDLNKKKCNCGNFGCLENYVSTRGLIKLAKKNNLKVDTYELEKLARKKNKQALKTYNEFGKFLAIGLVNIANTLDPEVIYLTGGLTNSSRFFLKSATKESKKRFFKGINPKIKIYSENLSLMGGFELIK